MFSFWWETGGFSWSGNGPARSHHAGGVGGGGVSRLSFSSFSSLYPCDNETHSIGSIFSDLLTHTKSRCWDWKWPLLHLSPPVFCHAYLAEAIPSFTCCYKTFQKKNGICWQEAGKQGTLNWDPVWKQCPGNKPTNTSDLKHWVTQQRGKNASLKNNSIGAPARNSQSQQYTVTLQNCQGTRYWNKILLSRSETS